VDLSLGALLERFYQPEVVQAAWDDVVDAFAEGQTAEVGEYCIAVLRELCEARGHKWSDLGLAYQLTRLLSDDIAVAVAAGAVDGETVSDWGATAGLSEEERLSLCRVAVAAEAARGDVAVWLLFVEAYVEGWQRLGPVQLFDAHLMPDGIRAGGALGGFDDYEAPPELGDWDADSVYSGDLGVPVGEHAVLARVWLPETLVELAPQRARVLVQTLVEVANDDSRWVLKDGEAAHRVGGDWYGSLGFDDPAVSGRTGVRSTSSPSALGTRSPSSTILLLSGWSTVTPPPPKPSRTLSSAWRWAHEHWSARSASPKPSTRTGPT